MCTQLKTIAEEAEATYGKLVADFKKINIENAENGSDPRGTTQSLQEIDPAFSFLHLVCLPI